jgi:hypothetical protein
LRSNIIWNAQEKNKTDQDKGAKIIACGAMSYGKGDEIEGLEIININTKTTKM